MKMVSRYRCAVNILFNSCKYRSKSFSTINETQHEVSHVSSGPLSHIKILDLSRVLAGPYCTMILGDLGAQILKIEHPEGGDDTRSWGPPFVESEDKLSRESCYFLSINRNKKSVCINLKKEEGRQLVRNLASQSDVFVENYLPGKLDSWGLGFSDLSKIAPQLIYCSISGFGGDGPYQNRAGYDVIAASLGGLMHITGPEDGEPCKVGVALTDLATGLYAHGAIMAALMERQKTGLGQKIECNLLSTQVATLVNLGSSYLNGGQEARRLGTSHASIVPYQSFQTKDGFMTIGCGNDLQYQQFCKLINKPEMASDPRFLTNQDRVKHRKLLVDQITQIMSTRTNPEWNQIFNQGKARFPFGPVNNLENVFSDPQVLHNKMVVEMEHQEAGTIKQIGSAVKFSKSENYPRFAPPPLGKHTKETLSQVLGLGEDEMCRLVKDGVIK